MKKQIIAMGGGGFSMEPDNLLLDEYVLAQSDKANPKICFISTASGDSPDYIQRFMDSFSKLECEPTHLALYRAPLGSLEEFVMKQDILYVGGGNTRNLLALWREWGLDVILRKAWEQGRVLAGLSAGSICWFEQGVTDSIPGALTPLQCLGFLKGSNCPHYDGEAERRPSYHGLMKEERIQPGYAADDGVALHFTSGEQETLNIVSSRPQARAYQVSVEKGQVSEKLLVPRYLG